MFTEQANIPKPRGLQLDALSARLQDAQKDLIYTVDSFAWELKQLLLTMGCYALAELNAIYQRKILPEVLMEAVGVKGPTPGIAAALGYLHAQGFDISSLRKSAITRNGCWYEVVSDAKRGDRVVCLALETPPSPP